MVYGSVPDPDPPNPRVFGLPDPDQLVRGMDPDPAPSIIMKNNKKNLESNYFVTLLSLFEFLSLKNNVNVPSKSSKQKKLC